MAGMGTMTVAKETKLSGVRIWLFRIFIIIGGGLMLYSWSLPWWNLDIEELGFNMVRLHPWGLEMDERLGSFMILLKGADMPAWFAPMMWAFLGVCMLALLAAIILVSKQIVVAGFLPLSTVLVGGVGIAYIVVGVVFTIYASQRMGAMYGAPLQGRMNMELGGELHSWVESHLLTGYYMCYVAGVYLLVLGLLRDMVVGES